MARRYKHVREDYNPRDTYKTPLTYGQQYGFGEYDHSLPTATRKTFCRTKCEESKYADSVATQNIFH